MAHQLKQNQLWRGVCTYGCEWKPYPVARLVIATCKKFTLYAEIRCLDDRVEKNTDPFGIYQPSTPAYCSTASFQNWITAVNATAED